MGPTCNDVSILWLKYKNYNIIMENILPLDEFSKIKGEIYKIVNKINNKIYIGQTRTYRKNKNMNV
jgi:hydrogenase maturation factor